MRKHDRGAAELAGQVTLEDVMAPEGPRPLTAAELAALAVGAMAWYTPLDFRSYDGGPVRLKGTRLHPDGHMIYVFSRPGSRYGDFARGFGYGVDWLLWTDKPDHDALWALKGPRLEALKGGFRSSLLDD